MRKFMVCAVMLALCAPAMATELGTIRGALKMSDGKTAVAGQAITVIDMKTGLPVAKATTDGKGAFEIASLPVGTYKVAAADNAFAIVAVPALPEVVVVDLTLPPITYAAGGGAGKGVILGAIGGALAGTIIAGTIAYQAGKSEGEDDEEHKTENLRRELERLRNASPSMP